MPDAVSLATLLARTTHELRKAETRLANLEHALGEIVCDPRAAASPRFHDLQDIDRVRQELAGLAGFLGALSESVPPEWDSRRTLGLDALAAALAHVETVGAGTGECELFD